MIEIGSVTPDDQSRRAFGCLPSRVTAVRALVEAAPVSTAVSSFTSVSLSPPLVSVRLRHTSTKGWHAEPATPPLVFHNSGLRRLSAA
jgi:flavin reductase (DIM6/NTAB) family NADH-FMN oxidoreductase RutF